MTGEHEADVISNEAGEHWMVCTCGYNVLLASRPVAEAYVEDHLSVFRD